MAHHAPAQSIHHLVRLVQLLQLVVLLLAFLSIPTDAQVVPVLIFGAHMACATVIASVMDMINEDYMDLTRHQ